MAGSKADLWADQKAELLVDQWELRKADYSVEWKVDMMAAPMVVLLEKLKVDLMAVSLVERWVGQKVGMLVAWKADQ